LYIYKTTNQINGKIYIGKSEKDVDENPEYLGSGVILKKAIEKYGQNNFKKEILYITESVDILNEKEIDYISYFKEMFNEKCYNLAEGGTGGNSLMFYNEDQIIDFKNKMSDLTKGKNNPFFGKKHTDETKLKISESKQGSVYSDEFKQKCSERMIGNDINKGRKQSKENIELKSQIFSGEGNPMFGKKHSEKTLNKISDSIRKSKELKFTCKHCGKEADKGNFNRWHGDNCKKNPSKPN
jgi:group I intron endonuclease